MPPIVSNFLNGIFFETLIFLILLKPKSLFKPNETIAINKFQSSRLTIDLSAKVADIGVPSTY